MPERFTDSRKEEQAIPVLLPYADRTENYVALHPEISQNFKKAKDAVVHVVVDSIDLKESEIRGLIDKKQAKKLAKELKKEKLNVSATGFFITDDGWLVTNHHVANIPGETSAQWPNGTKVKLRKYYEDKNVDLAIFKIDSNESIKVPYLPLAKTDTLSANERLTVVGYPNCWKDLHASPGNFLELGKRNSYLPDKFCVQSIKDVKPDLDIMQTSCLSAPGGSGSPTLSQSGEVIGVIFAGSPPASKKNYSFAIQAQDLRNAARQVPELRQKLGL